MLSDNLTITTFDGTTDALFTAIASQGRDVTRQVMVPAVEFKSVNMRVSHQVSKVGVKRTLVRFDVQEVANGEGTLPAPVSIQAVISSEDTATSRGVAKGVIPAICDFLKSADGLRIIDGEA